MPSFDESLLEPVGFNEDLLEPADEPRPSSSRFVDPLSVQPFSPEEESKLSQAVDIARIRQRHAGTPTEPGIIPLIQSGMHSLDEFIQPTPEPVAPSELAKAEEQSTTLNDMVNRIRLKEKIQAIEQPVETGLKQSVVGGVEAMRKPSGLLTLGGAAVAPEFVLPALAATTVPQIPDTIKEIQEARRTGDRAGYYKGVGDLLQEAAVVGGSVKGMRGRGTVETARPAAFDEAKMEPLPTEAAAKPDEEAQPKISMVDIATKSEKFPEEFLSNQGPSGEKLSSPVFSKEWVRSISDELKDPEAWIKLTKAVQKNDINQTLSSKQIGYVLREQGDASIPQLKAAVEAKKMIESHVKELMAKGDEQSMSEAMQYMGSAQLPSETVEAAVRSGKTDQFYSDSKFPPIELTPEDTSFDYIASVKNRPKQPQAEPAVGKEPNASSITSPAEVHGDVREQPVEGEQAVPVKEGVSGVRPNTPEGTAEAKVGEQQNVLPSLTPVPIGPGAATPSEFLPEKAQLIRTAFKQTNQRREQRGLKPVTTPDEESGKQVWEHAKKLIEDDPTVEDRLIKEITNTGVPVNWADLNTQDALLRHRYVDLNNDLEKAKNRMFEAEDAGDPVALREHQLRFSSILQDLDELDLANKMIGTQLGRGMQARQNWVNQDFSLVKMLGDKRASLGRKLTPDEEAKVAKEQKDLQAKEDTAKIAVAKADAEARAKDSNQTMMELGDTVRKETAQETSRGVERDLVGEQREVTGNLKDRFMEQGDLVGSNQAIRKLMELLYRQGITERVPMEQAVHDILTKQVDPTLTLEETQDLMYGYGKYKPLSKDPIKAGVRDIVGQGQQVRKLLDFFKGEAPKKTGFERRIPSDIERNWIKVVNEAKKAFGTIPTDPAAALKSALDSINTRLKNRLLDLQQEVATRQKIVRERNPSPYNEETIRLRNEIEEVKKQHAEIFGKPALTDAQRLAIAEKSADRQIEELERQLKSGEIFPKTKEPSSLTSAKLEAARARIEELKTTRDYARELIQPKLEPEARKLLGISLRYLEKEAEYKQKLAEGDFSKQTRQPVELNANAQAAKARFEEAKMNWRRGLEVNRMANRSTTVKVADAIAKWKRTAVLLWPTSLLKLTAAAAEGIGIGTAEEIIGTPYARLLPESVTSKAARYGEGLKISNEVKAYSDTWSKLIKNFDSALRTGNIETDLLHGKPDIVPKSMLDWIGNLHYALKTPLKQFEFSRSLPILMEHARRNGVDITDPGVIQRLGNEAYRIAEERLFLEPNVLTDMYQRALQRAMEPEKTTGKPTFTGKAVETLLRYELPIVRIPTNLVKRAFEYSFGTFTGSARLARAFMQGIDNLQPAEADAILRNLRRGTLGSMFLLYGFLHPEQFGGYYQEREKRSPNDVKYGGARIGGVDVPTVVLHHPLLEQPQIGATMRRVADSVLHRRDTDLGKLSAGAWAALMGLTDEAPFAREIKDTVKNLGQPEKFVGEQIKSAIPGAVQFTAQELDKDAHGNVIRRKPKTVKEHIEMGIPVMRKNVPVNPRP
jgi:hypothetical protein